jgi:phosphoglucomutase
MDVNPLAGKPATPGMLVDVPRLVAAYYTQRPDTAVPGQRVAFGTSGHRGSSFERSFNEAHVLAITEAICRYRREQGIDGPCSWGSTPTPSPTRPTAAPSRYWPPTT